jgi:tRNA (guanine37-N1)-methyltransferase
MNIEQASLQLKIDIMTLFPDTVMDVLWESILGRAQERGFIRIECHQIRDYTKNKQRQVDDYPYGGGRGAVMQAQPLYDCWRHICEDAGERLHTIYMSPCGKVFTQDDAKRLKRDYKRFIIVCGHYEGIDERAYTLADSIISIGDYVLTSGELASMVIIDAVVRKLPGVLGADEGAVDESFNGGLLEYPQYTRPAEYRGMEVPAVLRSGDHGAVDRWRREQSIERTFRLRPDLLADAELDTRDIAYLECLRARQDDGERTV